MMDQITVLVPVYQVERLLCRCADSILAQTFKDYQLILVDDGSSDNSGRICDEYARKDSRIQVIHQKNLGVSAARNTALDWVFSQESGPWLAFIDSDDWIHPLYLEALWKSAKKTGMDIVLCGYQNTNGEPLETDESKIEASVWRTEEYYCSHRIEGILACAKLYKAKCFQDVRFPAGRFHEDEMTIYKVLFQQDRIARIAEPMYAYYSNPNSIMHGKWMDRWRDKLDAYWEQTAYFKRNGYEKAYKVMKRSYIKYLASCVEKLKQMDEKEYPVRRDQLRAIIQDDPFIWKLRDNDIQMIVQAAYPEGESSWPNMVRKKRTLKKYFSLSGIHGMMKR